MAKIILAVLISFVATASIALGDSKEKKAEATPQSPECKTLEDNLKEIDGQIKAEESRREKLRLKHEREDLSYEFKKQCGKANSTKE